MIKKLIQHGNSAALVIDKPIMEMLHITYETTFELSTDGKNIILSPQNTVVQESDILESLKNINKKYGNVLKKLGE
jgi:antitoxin component of MazEF toxin-antitoxin module